MSPEPGLRYRRMILDWGVSRNEMEVLACFWGDCRIRGSIWGIQVWCDLMLSWGNCLPFGLLRDDIKAILFHLFFFLFPFFAYFLRQSLNV